MLKKLVVALGAITAASLVACGPTATSSASPSTPGAAHATANNGWNVAATAGPNLDVRVTITVIGPATVRSGCAASVTVTLANPDGSTVPTPRPGIRCMALTLVQVPAGASRDFTASAKAPHHGQFVVHSRVNATAEVTLPDLRIDV